MMWTCQLYKLCENCEGLDLEIFSKWLLVYVGWMSHMFQTVVQCKEKATIVLRDAERNLHCLERKYENYGGLSSAEKQYTYVGF